MVLRNVGRKTRRRVGAVVDLAVDGLVRRHGCPLEESDQKRLFASNLEFEID